MSDCLEWNISLINEELFEQKPNPKTLVDLFVCVLDSILSYESHSHPCLCHVFIRTHHLERLEHNIQNYSNIDIQSNSNICWVVQMLDKYRLLKQIYLRGLVDY